MVFTVTFFFFLLIQSWNSLRRRPGLRACLCLPRTEIKGIHNHTRHSLTFLRLGISLNVRLTNSARLAGQSAPRMSLSLAPSLTADFQELGASPVFTQELGIQSQSLSLCGKYFIY